MSRILEALRRVDGERAGETTPLARSAEPEPSRAPSSPPTTPIAESPLPPEAAPVTPWEADATPSLPEDFQRELAGLRLHVDTALADRRPRVLLFTSATPGEGTTTIAASFARVLAQDPAARVLLVDAHTRRPGLALFFGLEATAGLFPALAAGLPVEDLVQPVERHNLHVLPALAGQGGPVHVSAAQLRGFLGAFGVRYDYVIFDAPPVLEAPETIVLGGVVDTSILVLRAASTKGGVVNRAVDSLANAGVPVLGLVLNRRRFDIPEFIYRRI